MAHQFEGYAIAATARAVLFHGHYWEFPHWLPRSQIEVVPTNDDEMVIVASNWIANQKRLREFTHHEQEPEPF